LAETLDAASFTRAVAYWRQGADDDAAEREAREVEDARWARESRSFDGGYQLDAFLPGVAGREFQAVLHRLDNELFRDDWRHARDQLGRDPSWAELSRTPGQRRADALVLMARRAAAMPAGARIPEPLVVIHVDDRTVLGRLCELADGGVVPQGVALGALIRGRFEVAVFDAQNRVRVSKPTRLFRGHERRAVEIRDRTCTYVSPSGQRCTVPAEACDVDHVIPWAAGGTTTQQNGRLRCPHHHPGRRRNQTWHTERLPGGDDGGDSRSGDGVDTAHARGDPLPDDRDADHRDTG
jgi:hypothetical protein